MMKLSDIAILTGFMGTLVAASGLNPEQGSIKVNVIVMLVSIVLMLIGLLAKNRRYKERW